MINKDNGENHLDTREKDKKSNESGRTISVIKELSKLTDLAAYQAYIGRKTSYGRKPHPSDAWGYTREFLTKYQDEQNFGELVRLFAEAGAANEQQAALLVATNIKHVK